MLKKYPQFSFAFAIIFVFEIIALANNLVELTYITKPLIAISLIAFVVITLKKESRFKSRIIKGLVFSLMGDALLMFTQNSELYFIFGLVAFLIAHLFYISAFYLDYKNIKVARKSYLLHSLVFFGVFCIGFYLFLRPHLGDMKIPVMVYAFVISLMAIMSTLRYDKTTKNSFVLIFTGALFFLLSDSLLAYNKFVEKIWSGDIWVMSTYMIAQFLITIGTVERKNTIKN